MKEGTLRVIQMAGRFPGLIAGGAKTLETRKNLSGWRALHDGTFADLPHELSCNCLYLFAKGNRLLGTAALFGRWYPLWASGYCIKNGLGAGPYAVGSNAHGATGKWPK